MSRDSFEEFLRKEREARLISIKSAVEEVTRLMQEAGIEEIEAPYSGSGDDGYFHEVTADNVSLENNQILIDAIDNLGRLLLSHHYEGWEINEGSQGVLHLGLQDGKLGASIEHSWLEYVEQPPIDALPDAIFDGPKDAPSGNVP